MRTRFKRLEEGSWMPEVSSVNLINNSLKYQMILSALHKGKNSV